MIRRRKPECEHLRERLEAGSAVLGEESQHHLASCGECREYAQLAQWAHGVVLSGAVEAEAPAMSSVWASIHRASEQAWDSALTRSFRYLLPYMVAVVALIALVGGMMTVRTPRPVRAASAALAVLNQPEPSAVTAVMASASQPSQDPTDLLQEHGH
ncbi:MAG: hypothetical protein ACRD0Y_09595 [Terriglobales bacterium]